MATIISVSIDLSKIPQMAIKQLQKRDGSMGQFVDVLVAVNDELDSFGNNASATVGQSKEQREQGAQKIYLGNGRVIWSSTGVPTAKQLQEQQNGFGGQQNGAPQQQFGAPQQQFGQQPTYGAPQQQPAQYGAPTGQQQQQQQPAGNYNPATGQPQQQQQPAQNMAPPIDEENLPF